MLTLAHQWWLVLLRGLCAILFGILAFAWPGLTLLALAIMWGVYAIADGITALTMAGAGRRHGSPGWWLVLEGVLGIIAGVIAVIHPKLAIFVLLLCVGIWAIIRGISEIIAAFGLRREVRNEWMLLLSGVVSVLFGIVLIARPMTGALAVVWAIGALSIVYGAFMISLSLRLRGMKANIEHHHEHPGAAPPATPGIA